MEEQDSAWDLVYEAVSVAVRAEVDAEESARHRSLYENGLKETAATLKAEAKDVWLKNQVEKCEVVD